MVKRKMSPLLVQFYKLAKDNGLDHAFGRAVALLNRHHNDGRGYQEMENFTEALDKMKMFKVSTAERWAEHWKLGGSIKALKYSQDAWLTTRRFDYAEKKEYINRNRRDARANEKKQANIAKSIERCSRSQS